MKPFVVRLSDDLHAQLAGVAKVEGNSMNATAQRALDRHIAERRADPEFRARLERIMRDEADVLRRLA